MKRPLSARLLLLAAAFPLFGGCVAENDRRTPEAAGPGTVKVTVDWTEHSSDAALPGSYVLRIGDREQAVSRETNVFDSLLSPGRQRLLVYHRAKGITLSAGAATVNTLPDGTLDPMPGYLFSAVRELEITGDDTLRVAVPMKQHVRKLTLTLRVAPGDEERIAQIHATLSGIASALDLNDGSIRPGVGKTVVPVFDVGTGRNHADMYGRPEFSAALRLLGTEASEKQILTLVLTLTDGQEKTFVNDLTDKLKGFATAYMEPMELKAPLELPGKAGLTGIIGDWALGNEESGEIW